MILHGLSAWWPHHLHTCLPDEAKAQTDKFFLVHGVQIRSEERGCWMFFGHFGKSQTMRKSLFSRPVSTLQQGLSGITVMNFSAWMTTDAEALLCLLQCISHLFLHLCPEGTPQELLAFCSSLNCWFLKGAEHIRQPKANWKHFPAPIELLKSFLVVAVPDSACVTFG